MKLGLPKNRTATSAQFFLSGATLKKGDHTIIDDYKITVVEAGTYGDVVKVEKI